MKFDSTNRMNVVIAINISTNHDIYFSQSLPKLNAVTIEAMLPMTKENEYGIIKIDFGSVKSTWLLSKSDQSGMRGILFFNQVDCCIRTVLFLQPLDNYNAD